MNPWLHLVRVDGTDGAPIAASVIFSIHGTGISHSDTSYNADVWAYLKGELGRRIEHSTGHRPVVGAVEGTHGDVAPAVRPGLLVYPEAQRVGSGIGAAAAELYDRLEGELDAAVQLGAAFRELDLASRPRVDGITLPAPAFGAATIAGAFENTTPIVHRIPPFRPGAAQAGRARPTRREMDPGRAAGHDLVIAPSAFPSVLPLQLLRIGPLLVVGLPFEVTVEAGRRVAAAARAASWRRRRAHRGVVAGQRAVLLPDHAGGVQPAALRGRQHALRPAEPAVRRRVRGTAGRRPGHRPGRRAAGRAHLRVRGAPVPGAAHRRAPCRSSRSAPPAFNDPTSTEDGYWELRWRGPAPGELAWHEPLVRVEAATAEGGWAQVADDRGYHLGVAHLGSGRADGHRYAARWHTAYLGPGRKHRFVLLGARGGDEVASVPFV